MIICPLNINFLCIQALPARGWLLWGSSWFFAVYWESIGVWELQFSQTLQVSQNIQRSAPQIPGNGVLGWYKLWLCQYSKPRYPQGIWQVCPHQLSLTMVKDNIYASVRFKNGSLLYFKNIKRINPAYILFLFAEVEPTGNSILPYCHPRIQVGLPHLRKLTNGHQFFVSESSHWW